MSIDAHELMASHQGPKFLARVGETLRVWRQRQLQRRELARWSERDLHDVGLCWSDIVYEAEKPFWRA
ncbi:MAG: hypothetical protein JWQ17_3302 [Tardiphaga sp.]|jgi:uncharacterized protein YjiS (DUF1127 family)|nr:hypothetical protein [Tardiphaga sp.]